MKPKIYGGVFLTDELFFDREFEYEDDARFDEASEFECEYCGCRIGLGEDKLRVEVTGDIIHRKCWLDYADENADELCSEV